MIKKYTRIPYSVEAIQWNGNNLHEIRCFDPSTSYSTRGKYNYIVGECNLGYEIGSWLVKKSFCFEDIRDPYGNKTGNQRRVDEDYYFWLSNDEFNNEYQDENK